MSNIQSVKQKFGIVGRSEGLDRALTTAIRVANTELSVLIRGESGVGKEVFSRVIHDLSPRKHNKFLPVNCGAIPPGTINSELFGHEKGAFTGATSDRKGYFEILDGGTIFLDEIGEMPLDTQSYLLRVLESGEFIKVGSNKIIKTNVRVIAATNIDIETKIRQNKFREDLYYRLNTVPIFVPSLKERKEDIYMLTRKFAVDFSEKYKNPSIQLTEDARSLLERYSWPGNIRELKNVVEQLSVLSEDSLIDVDSLLELIPQLAKRHLPSTNMANSAGSLEGSEEREILYKFLIDMKSDLNDLKNLVYNLISTNDLDMPVNSNTAALLPSKSYPAPSRFSEQYGKETQYESNDDYDIGAKESNTPYILGKNEIKEYEDSEVVEENLSIEAMEKELIMKALKKYNSRRKDAAAELGISERTLYRKIKQYEIPD